MANIGMNVNLLGVIPQYQKEETDKKNDDGSTRMKNTDIVIGYHVFYCSPIKRWTNETSHNTIAIKDFNSNHYDWLLKLKYLDELTIVVDLEDIGKKPNFVRFEQCK